MKALYFTCWNCGEERLGLERKRETRCLEESYYDVEPSYGTLIGKESLPEKEICSQSPFDLPYPEHDWAPSKKLHPSQEEEISLIKELPNLTLYEELLKCSGGDDWDGDFTNWGRFEFESLEAEFRVRLKDWLELG